MAKVNLQLLKKNPKNKKTHHSIYYNVTFKCNYYKKFCLLVYSIPMDKMTIF